MNQSVFVYDPTSSDQLSKVRGIGRYMQIMQENFPEWTFTDQLPTTNHQSPITFINPFFNMLQPPLNMNRIAKKQIAVIHDLIPLKYPQHFPIGIKGKLNIFLNKIALHNYDIVITDSESSKKDIVSILRLPEHKIHVVYPCLPKVFSSQYSESSMKKNNSEYRILNTEYCLYVGDATWNKNLVNLAKVIQKANITCIFAGKVFEQHIRSVLTKDGPYNPWQKELREFLTIVKGDERFILKGFVSDNELINLYQQATLNMLPSRDEGFGFSYLEAASKHCPSVLSDIPVLHEISAENAVFTNFENTKETADIIQKYMQNSALRTKIAQNAHDRSLYFSSEQFKKHLSEAINS